MTTLSICMIVRNEQKNLPRFFKSIQGLADEIIVVDTGSKDRTKQIVAREPKAKLLEMKWDNDFSKARNVSLQAATKEWILVLDPDEKVEDHREIRSLLGESGKAAFHIKIRNMQPKGSLTQFEDSYLIRLFRNQPYHRFVGRIHEQISPSIHAENGEVGLSQAMIVHYGYIDDKVQGNQSRRARNLALLQKELTDNPTDFYYLFHMGLAHKVIDTDEAKKFFEQSLSHGKKQDMPEQIEEQIHMRLAQIALEEYDNGQAILHAKKSLAINPMNLISRVCLVTAQIGAHAFVQAIPNLKLVLAQGKNKLPNPQDFERMLVLCQQQVVKSQSN